MRKVAHPACCGCGSANPSYESELFQVRVCYQCLRVVARWFVMHGLIQSHPLAEELLDGVWDGGSRCSPTQYKIWYENPQIPFSNSEVVVHRLVKTL